MGVYYVSDGGDHQCYPDTKKYYENIFKILEGLGYLQAPQWVPSLDARLQWRDTRFLYAVATTARKGIQNSNTKLKPVHIEEYTVIFIEALIENPSFNSQTKE